MKMTLKQRQSAANLIKALQKDGLSLDEAIAKTHEIGENLSSYGGRYEFDDEDIEAIMNLVQE